MEHSRLNIRRATRDDLPAIVRLLADDPLGQQREVVADPLPESYAQMFALIDSDPRHELIVVELDGEVIGTAHLMLLPSLSYRGSMRAQVESVRVDRRYRSQGVGTHLFRWLIDRARAKGCRLVQLTTHAQRADAHRFYERLGFVASHVGMKLDLAHG